MEIVCYEDLILKSVQEISVTFLMEKVMSALHMICVESEHTYGFVNFGVGFPQYNMEKKSLGHIIRLFATKDDILQKLSSDTRLVRLDDYVQKGEISPIPTLDGYVQYRRVQFKENKDRLVRRYAKRHQTNLKLTESRYSEYKRCSSTLPYITMDSLSSRQRFKLYIKELTLRENSSPLVFNSYGLTKSGALPHF